jgi:hypothetical protein
MRIYLVDAFQAMADVLVIVIAIAIEARVLARHGRQIRRRRAQRLHTGLFVDAAGVHRQWSRNDHSLRTVKADVTTSTPRPSAFELRVALFEVIAHAVGLEFLMEYNEQLLDNCADEQDRRHGSPHGLD